MAFFRVQRTREYTVMSNYHLRDQNLTLKAKGLLSMMLSLPNEWELYHAGTGRHMQGGRGCYRFCSERTEIHRLYRPAPSAEKSFPSGATDRSVLFGWTPWEKTIPKIF